MGGVIEMIIFKSGQGEGWSRNYGLANEIASELKALVIT